jgi:hypothetical protein
MAAVCGIVSCSAFAAYPTTGLQLHLDASSLTGYAQGSPVTLWPDLAGGDHNATSTGTPSYIANALNGRPAIKIKGTSDLNNNSLPASTDYFSFSQVSNVKTIALVFKRTSAVYYTWSTFLDSPTGYAIHGDHNWGTAYWDKDWSIDSVRSAGVSINGRPPVDGGWTSVPTEFHIALIQIGSGTPLNLGLLAHTSNYSNGNVYGMEIAELLLYNQPLSAADAADLADELGHKYGLWSVRPQFPLDGATMVPASSELRWKAYDAAWPVDVYVDPNQSNVETGKPAAKVVSGEAVSSYDPALLAYDTAYYWRVDVYEPNTAGSGYLLRQGPVWTFTTMPPDPLATLHPVSQTVDAGSPVTLSAGGENVESYQWYRQGILLSGKTSATLDIPSLGIADEGVYHCVISNAVGSVESNPAVVVSKRLAGWWKLDGNLNDSVAAVIPGAPAHPGAIADPNFVPTGKDGGAYAFFGDGRTIVIDSSSDYFNFYPRGLTVSAWIKTTQTGWGGFVGKIESNTSGFYLTHSGTLSASGMRGVGQVQYDTQVYDVWQLVTMTWDASAQTMSHYVDGKLQSQSVYAVVPPVDSLPLYFGAENADGTAFPYAGLLDDVKIWSYPLDGLAIAHLYTDLTPGSEICLDNPMLDVSGPAGLPDCRINVYDLVVLAAQWLDCNIVPTCIE